MNKLFSLICVVALAACAPMTWVKPGATRDDFSRARYSCVQQSQQRVSGAVVNQFGGYATNQVVTNEGVFDACMNAEGWYLQEQTATITATATAPARTESWGFPKASAQPTPSTPR